MCLTLQVNAFDGGSVDARRMVHLDGASLPSVIIGSGSVMMVQFTTDGSITRSGFRGTFSCGPPAPPAPPDACQSPGLSLQNSGEVDHTGGHGDGEDCQWVLTCTNDHPTITFDSFDTETNFDFVNIYDGANVNAAVMAHLHGTTLPSPITGTGSVMVVQFTSDASVQRDGFHGTFSW